MASRQRRTGRLLSAPLPGGSVDELCHLSALGSEREDEASRMFVQLFDEADAKFELSKSAELLDVVGDPAHRHSEAFLETVKARRCRLRARQMWSDEFFRTTAYHERRPLTDGLELLMRDQTRWILQIYAGAAWARRCSCAGCWRGHFVPKGIPCARLDFDFEQAVVAERAAVAPGAEDRASAQRADARRAIFRTG